MRQRAAHQKGFTLIEVLVVVAIVGMLVPVLTLSIVQVIQGTDRNKTMVLALADIEHAVSWLNQDLMAAQMTNLPAYPLTVNLVSGGNLTLSWTDYYGGNATAHQSLYYLSGSKLMRDYDWGQVANIASSISQAEFSQDISGKVFTVTLSSSPQNLSGGSQTKTYRIYRRSE